LRNAGLAVAYPERTQTQFREHEKYLLRKEVADKYGLTVFDESQTVAELSNYQEPLSTVDFMQTANEFLAKYDLWIGSDPLATYGHNMEAADAKQLRRGASGRAAVIGVIRAVASKPKQYFDKLGIQRVLLAQQEPDMPMRAGGYIASDLASKDIGPSFVMNLDAVSTFQDAQTIAEHEIRHRLTYLEDGGAYDNDPTFNNVVGTDVYGKIGPEPPDSEPDTRPYVADKQDLHSVEQYQKAVSKIDFNISAHIGDASCYEVAESIDATVQKLGSTVYYASNYSKKSVVEHKAELPVTEPDRYKVYLDENLPHIQEQFEYGVANMYEWSPRIARYFIELSERPNTRPDADADLSVITKLNSRQADCKWYELHPERVKELKG
ncbi:MAG TPA: hypothetical protein VLF43_01665, partial [Candidatus Saccharimonadales bacterium]|nr:hypothetical protein [Candidatus Saccharimonadales bacterium]